MHPFPTSLEDMETLLRFPMELSERTLAFDAKDIRANEGKLLVEASTVQWLATWARTLRGRIHIESGANEAPIDALKRISDTLPGALLGLLTEHSLNEIPRIALARYKDAFFKQQRSWPDLSVHDRASLLCLDNVPPSIGLPPQLYPLPQSMQVAGRDQFVQLVDQLIKAVTAEANIRGAIKNHRERLTTILHELFKNTHDHARTTVNKQPLPLSIRGPYARFYTAEQLVYTAPPIQKDANGIDILPILNQAERYASYFLRPRALMQDRHFLGLLELSVFDTGPGFAATYLKGKFADASVQEQFDAVLGCFSTGRSSTGDESRGYGLWKVLRDLRELKGFIRVRTNRVHVYRDFAWYGDMFLQSDIVAPAERMMDWRRGITQKITEEYPDMQGAHVAVLIPLGDNL
ncbi:hypothetical protein JAB9_08930 [Janthinobacterium sp. HH107]|uniref:hypothetical protein n=1 Tax=Janthinobacterium sp. HH107 TaxID=1537279 RepID=UPI000893674D|nr:hypothetical protein [Janthinobacterium sp. HH107]OFA05217.1 hypothetical protein JAB9_08930 [Janthinobacterium sp. HH107]